MPKKPESHDAPKVDAIQIGTLLPGSTPHIVDGRTWRFGLAQTEAGQQAVYTVGCDWRELYVQVIVASVGRALNLPIPPCYILMASSETFPEIESKRPFLLFAGKAGPHPTLAAFALRTADVVDILLHGKRETANRLIVLDEWASNHGRDSTATLVDPARGLQFIDHHPSLGAIDDPAHQIRNWAFDAANAQMTELDILRLRKEMQASAHRVFDIDLGKIANQAAAFGSKDETKVWLGMLDFMAERRHHLEDLFCQRLGIPELRLNFTA